MAALMSLSICVFKLIPIGFGGKVTSRIAEEKREDFYLYIDEFQNFTTDSIASILSEARKYKLNLIMAHQYMPQLTDQIREAVLGNVGTIGAFRIGAEDAENQEKQFEPGFTRFDLVNLDFWLYLRKLLFYHNVGQKATLYY
jgi:hypothetical protein